MSTQGNQAADTGLGGLRALADVPAHTWRVFFICLIGVTFANFDHSLFTFVLTEFSEEFGWSLEARGWYIFITFLLAGLIITQLGVLTDRLGRKKMLLSTTMLMPIFVAVLTFVPNTLTLIIARTIGFSLAGAQSPITITTVLEESPSRLRGLFSGVLQIGFPIGFFLASLLVPWVMINWGWRYIFLLALLFLPYIWVIHRYLREPAAWVAARDRRAQGEAHPSTRELFRPDLRRKTILLFLGQFLYVFAYGTTILLTAYFRESLGWGAEQAIKTVGLSFLVGAFGYVAAAVVGEFLMSRRNAIVLWCCLGGVAFAAMVWLAESYQMILLTFCTMTFFFYGAYAVIATFIAENFPPELRATAASFSGSLAIELGLGGGPLVVSYIIAASNWQWGFTWCAVLPVLLAALIFLRLKPVPRDAT